LSHNMIKSFLSVFVMFTCACLLFFTSQGSHTTPSKVDFNINDNNVRLIQFNESQVVKMTQQQVDELIGRIGEEIHFSDITETPNLSVGAVPQPSPLPSEPRFQTLVQSISREMNVESMTNIIKSLSNFHTRHYQSPTGKQAAEWIQNFYTTIIKSLPQERQNLFSVSYFQHTWLQPSVICRIKGESDELVIIGAHEDSIAGGVQGRSPGSDDNASGTSTVLEVFRALAKSDYKPKKTIEIHHYAGEEVGLLGSRAIANSYKSQNKKVYASLNMDMDGYHANAQNRVGVATDGVDPVLTGFVRKLVSTYSDLLQGNITCGYSCSDHFSMFAAGYRSSHIFEAQPMSNMNRAIHTSSDTFDKLNMERALKFAKIALGFVVELSNQ